MESALIIVKEALSEVLKVPIDSIQDDSDIYQEYGIDSLSAVKTLALLDQRLDIEIPDENLHEIRTPRDLANVVAVCLDEKGRQISI